MKGFVLHYATHDHVLSDVNKTMSLNQSFLTLPTSLY